MQHRSIPTTQTARPGSRRRALAITAAFSLRAAAALAQPEALPPIGTIDYYGLGSIAPAEVEALLPFAVGDEMTEPARPGPTAEALGVARVEFSYVCCTDDGLFQIYVGIQDNPAGTRGYRDAPDGDARLPGAMIADFDELENRLLEAVLAGESGEDRSDGHALSPYPPLRRLQERFIVHANDDPATLRRVLSGSADARQRAAAAHILGYSADKPGVAPTLAAAALDPDEAVRNYATRALAVIAEYAQANPDAGIDIPAEPFLTLLDSIIWSDRNKGLGVMAQLTAGRDRELLDRLRETSLDSLIEMCRWQHWGHAEPACLILQRVTGLPDDTDERSRNVTLARAAAERVPGRD
jgi:hypothetical protein